MERNSKKKEQLLAVKCTYNQSLEQTGTTYAAHRKVIRKMKTYKISNEYKFLIAVFLLIITWAGLPPYRTTREYLYPAICIIIWVEVLSTVFDVTITKENIIRCKTLLKTIIINPDKIEKTKDGILSYSIYHNDSKTEISTLINNAYDLKKIIENKNSGIDIESFHFDAAENLERKNPFIAILIIMSFICLGIIIKYIWYFI